MRRVDRDQAIKRNFLAGVFLFLLVLFALGALRYQAARLAYRLDALNREIGRYSLEETALRQEFSGLVSPIKIYSYCKERLGMEKVQVAESLTVPVREGRFAADRGPEPVKGWRTRFAWLFGGSN